MSASGFLLYASAISLLILAGGLGAVLMPLYRGWFSGDLREQVFTFRQAADFETALLLPGMAASGVTNILWAAETGHDFLSERWIWISLTLYVVATFVFLPLMGLGLRRARLLALQSDKAGALSDELREALGDKVPIVFGTLIALMMPALVWLRIFQPS